MVTEVFLTFSITSFIGCVLAMGNLFYRNKCKEVGLCCLTIKRDVEIEEKEDMEMMRQKSSNVEENKEWVLICWFVEKKGLKFVNEMRL